ncbi:MAG TPA: hypothetical protein VGC41_01345, partial [Kofleriaceae bacterium]
AKIEANDAHTGEGAGGDRESFYRARLADDVRASRGMTVLAGFGVILLFAGAVLLVRGTRKLPVISGVVVVGLACWLVGLYNA